MSTFMATVNWRGALHIDPMRSFDTAEKAWAYARTLNGGNPRVYQLFEDQPPKLIKDPWKQ